MTSIAVSSSPASVGKAERAERADLTAVTGFCRVTRMHAVTERRFAFTSTTGLVRPEARCG